MRRIFILCISLAMSALAFNNCAYPEWEPEPSTGTEGGFGTTTPVLPAVTDFSIVASVVQTKSGLSETGELVWNDGDLVNVFHNVAGEADLVSDGVVYYDSKDEQENVFKGLLGKKLKESFVYDWYVFYPYTADLSIVDNAAPITIGSPAAGSQTQNGYDNPSHISGKYMPMYGTATGVDADETPVTELSHLASVIKINLANCMTSPTKITEVKITASEEIVGSFVYDFVKGTLTPVEGMASKTAVLTVDKATELVEGDKVTFYFIVKPFVAKAADGLKITVDGLEKTMVLNEDLAFAAGTVTAIDYTYYDVNLIEDSLLGKFKIKKMWVYGGTGPSDGGTGWVDLHNKTWWFDEGTGHGITAELDNYIEFTLTDLLEAGAKRTGKCINWAGVNGKNWSCFFHNSKVNEGDPTDARNFYRQIPIGESTWVRDLTVTPNTVTFTDAYGNVSVVEVYEPKYEFVPGYKDSNAAANTRIFPRSEEDDLTFHAKVKGKDNWTEGIIYSEVDKIFYNPRDFFIDVERVDEIPAAAMTYEKPYDPTDLYPETLAGKYKYGTDYCIGGKDGSITMKGLIAQFGTWTEPLTGDGRKFCDIIKTIQNDTYTFTPTGTDEKQNEVGTVTFDDGGDGTWEYQVMDNKSASPFTVYDATELYGFIAHDNSTTYVYDRAGKSITFKTRDKEYVVKYLLPGKHTYSMVTNGTKDFEIGASSFAMQYNQGYEKSRVEGYTETGNGFARHYVWARYYILCLEKM